MSNIKLSVIVAMYNIEKYIKRCLESLEKQTLKKIEIIVVDDGSDDGSSEIAKKYLKKNKNFKYFRKSNEGLSMARNFGISKSLGEFIGFVDGDDYVDFKMFEKMYKCALINKSDIVICEYWKVFKNKKIYKKNPSKAYYYNSSILKNPEILNSRSYAWNKIYHRNFFFKNNHYFPYGKIFEDSYTIYNLMLDAKKISLINEGLYYYDRTRKNSITNTINNNIFDIFNSFDSIITKYKQSKISNNNLKKQIYFIILRHLLTRYKKIHSRNFSFIGIKFIFFSFDYLDKNIEDLKLLVKDKSLNFKKYYIKIYYNKILNPIYYIIPLKLKIILKKISLKSSFKIYFN